MGSDRFENWLHSIAHTAPEEISCTECFDSVSGYVELELAGGDLAAKMPQVRQHLEQCPACREEYEVLRDLRRLEEEGHPPSLDDLQASIR